MAIQSCTTQAAPVTGVVVFDYAEFIAAYPEFATVSSARLAADFAYATTIITNRCGSVVCDAAERQILIYTLTAHIAAILDGVNGQPPSGVVGRIASATEGSVSVTLDMGAVDGGQAWYEQTRWGALYWAMTAKYRAFQYVPAPASCYDYDGPLFPADNCGC